jgi:16S rRNA (guanine(966)-N(2))-methyltransferase RsmD
VRVITGKAKGRRLQSVPGDTTRPITDRAKEALFSILGTWVVGTRVLDLFGGTGAVGIECLSRGADSVHFIDSSRAAVETINANLAHCRLEGQATVERGDSFAFLQRFRGEPFDLIYVAPPQYKGLWRRALLEIDARPGLLADFGAVIVQIDPREEEPIELAFLEEYDRRRYGSVMLVFYASAAALAEEGDEEEGEEYEEYDDEEDFDDEELLEDESEDDESEEEDPEDDEFADEEPDPRTAQDPNAD